MNKRTNRRSIASIAEEILVEAGHPLHYKEITRLLLSQHKLAGNTPHESVRSRMATNFKFKRVAEGVFGLARWKQYPVIRYAKDIAYDILQDKNEPMTLVDLGLAIFQERTFASDPKVVVRNILRTDRRFHYYPKTGLVSLAEWKGRK